jgi:drug/metabolite transporter (DMT)-like permease
LPLDALALDLAAAVVHALWNLLTALLVRGTARGRRGTALGLAVAACIAGYTLVDNVALDHAAAVPYLELVMAPTAVLYLAGAAALRGPRALVAELRPSTVLAGLGMFGAYALALAALARAEAAPVAAVRESRVVIASALAAIALREHVDRRRWLGAVLVVAGIAAIALAG